MTTSASAPADPAGGPAAGAGPGREPAAAPLPALTVDELAARAGTTVRTVRFYGSRGLLPPPVLGPRRVGRYGPAHLARLALIEELRHQGLTLAAIERYLEQLPEDTAPEDLAIHRALVASWTPAAAEDTTRDRLERRAGRPLSDGDLDRLAAMGVLERTDDPGTLRVLPGVLHLGVRLLEVPFPMETILATRDVVQRHTRAVAHELQQLFRDTVWRPYREEDHSPEEVERMRALTEHIQPVLVQALVTAFQRSLREEVEASGRERP
ncbi:MerR family transcriptional regulator [Streptacidiphilus sp. ASG 303]|uniref:MerR family transcriptional regulator n=1 Tax=Streptacidiphilus sp. ASG 303 TaxID=2896847 RepID=UPI001E2BF59A|nr:MerR family transcriptional regulator [Streptacidiphilus sp. ASG 303]MCD0481286.1 MerR family transcriptional regulator [Streptacidiphilus sp. ASG 303]